MRKKTLNQRRNRERKNGLMPAAIFAGEVLNLLTEVTIKTPKLIKTWDELKECKSETHILEIEDCCGWIHCKLDKGKHAHYLSTHTFYGGTYKNSTKLLQACGFDVELANWDELGW